MKPIIRGFLYGACLLLLAFSSSEAGANNQPRIPYSKEKLVPVKCVCLYHVYQGNKITVSGTEFTLGEDLSMTEFEKVCHGLVGNDYVLDLESGDNHEANYRPPFACVVEGEPDLSTSK